ncbi:hypothetical protein NN6n1_13010 [Shinella zoogloeoides]
MQQLSMFDLMMPPPPPAIPVARSLSNAERKKMSSWQIEQIESQNARYAFRASLPSDDAGLLSRAWTELASYDAAVRAVDYDRMVEAGNHLRAIGEHAFGLSEAEDRRDSPPKGNARFDCLYAAWDWMSDALAANDGEIPMFGQKAHLELDIAGCRVDFRYAGMFGICGGDARVIDHDKPFFSETGYRSFQVCPIDHVIAAKGIDCKQWLERVCLAQLTEGGKRKIQLTRAWPGYCLTWRQSKEFADKADRTTTWDQWGPEKQAELWANHDASQAAALERMAAEGIDPEEVWRTRR